MLKTTVISFRLGFQSNSFLHFLFLLRGYRYFNCTVDTRWWVTIITFSLRSVHNFPLTFDASESRRNDQRAISSSLLDRNPFQAICFCRFQVSILSSAKEVSRS